MNKIRCRFPLLRLLMALCVAYACTTQRPEGKTEAEVLYKEAVKMVEDSKYLMATEKLNTLKAQHPYSYFAKHAELLLADILFAQENYAEASAAYILFRDFHPKHEKIEYVVWRIGESFYKQLPPTHDRDLAAGIEAIKYYKEIVDKYPKGEYVQQAQDKIRECEKMLREKDRYVADFYFKTGVYESARHRYLDILNSHAEQELLSHAIARVIESSYLLKEYKECTALYERYAGKVEGINAENIEKYGRLCEGQQ